MAPHHRCVSSTCALCGVASCLAPNSFPLRLHNTLAWTHNIVVPSLTLPNFVIHQSCFAILKQQYEILANRFPSDGILIAQISERIRIQPGHNGQLPIAATWTESYIDPQTGKGPIHAQFPDGWRPDIWELTEDPAIEMRASDMDFLLRDPLVERGVNYRRVLRSAKGLVKSILATEIPTYRRNFQVAATASL